MHFNSVTELELLFVLCELKIYSLKSDLEGGRFQT